MHMEKRTKIVRQIQLHFKLEGQETHATCFGQLIAHVVVCCSDHCSMASVFLNVFLRLKSPHCTCTIRHYKGLGSDPSRHLDKHTRTLETIVVTDFKMAN